VAGLPLTGLRRTADSKTLINSKKSELSIVYNTKTRDDEK